MKKERVVSPKHIKEVKKFYSDKTIQWFLENYMVKHISRKATIEKLEDKVREAPYNVVSLRCWGTVNIKDEYVSNTLKNIIYISHNNSSNCTLWDPETKIFITLANSTWGSYLRVFEVFGFITAHVIFKYNSIPNIFYKEMYSESGKEVLVGEDDIFEIVKGIMERSKVWFTSEISENFFGCTSNIFVDKLKNGIRNGGYYSVSVNLCFQHPIHSDTQKINCFNSANYGRIHFYEDEAKEYRRKVFERKLSSEINKITKFKRSVEEKVEKLREMEEKAFFLDADILAQLDMNFEDVYPTENKEDDKS